MGTPPAKLLLARRVEVNFGFVTLIFQEPFRSEHLKFAIMQGSSHQIYYISKMQTYERTRKTCSPDYLATVMDDHTNETVPKSVLTEHGLNKITCHMYTPATCGNQCLEGVDHVGIFITPQPHGYHKMHCAPALRTGHHELDRVCSERLSLSTSDAASYKPARNWFIS